MEPAPVSTARLGAAAFGHLPVIFVPGGPMTSGISNAEKARVRALYAQGQATREELPVGALLLQDRTPVRILWAP